MIAFAQQNGASGLAYIVFDETGVAKGPIAKLMKSEELEQITKLLEAYLKGILLVLETMRKSSLEEREVFMEIACLKIHELSDIIQVRKLSKQSWN